MNTFDVLVVQHHDALREVTVLALQSLGYGARGVTSESELNQALQQGQPDCVVLDEQTPGMESLGLIARLRGEIGNAGLVLLSSGHRAGDSAARYRNGADICLGKPVSMDDLSAAIVSLTRRLSGERRSDEPLALSARTLQVQGPRGRVDLTGQECELLLALTRAPGQRLPTPELLEALSHGTVEPSKAALEVQIVRLRKKLLEAGAPDPTIKAIRKLGYQLCPSVHVQGEYANASVGVGMRKS